MSRSHTKARRNRKRRTRIRYLRKQQRTENRQ